MSESYTELCTYCGVYRLSVENGNVSHSKKVVESVLEEDKLRHFQQEWRQHFLDSMQPKHLPKLWSVTHNPFSL